MLNWRRDPDYERRMNAKLIEIRKIKRETERIRRETEQLRRENKRLKELNSRLDALLRSPDFSCSTPPETDCC
jgi:predicted RNase H-like nuclease (RuvC/YqgF family)